MRPVDWAQSAALLVRRAAAETIGWFDPAFFVYSDEVDFCSACADAGWAMLYVPEARAVHHEPLAHGDIPQRRIVELSRNRDRYMRKHHSAVAAFAVRCLTAWAFAWRAVAALVRPARPPPARPPGGGGAAARTRRGARRGGGALQPAARLERARAPPLGLIGR